jgi:sulfhydrogenase subunit beta (sulfur reductase)
MADRLLHKRDLGSLFERLSAAGYRILGPRLREGAMVFAELGSVDELPRGMRDVQSPGAYRTVVEGDRYFDWANGPQALKPLTFASHETLWECRRGEDGHLEFVQTPPEPRPTAVIGVRGCDLAALDLQDRHFLAPGRVDSHYQTRRNALFLIAVHCNHPAATCFCASTGDGPRAGEGFDIALQEIEEGFLIEAGSSRGSDLLERLPLSPATSAQLAEAEDLYQGALEHQKRGLPSRDLSDALFAALEHPRWDEVAGRCLACGNCTAVCPTCFCSDLIQEPSLDGRTNTAHRQWDSCYTAGHSYFAGRVLRKDIRTRYRQWLTHKLGGWHAQFGRSGCTGCGRCITWCPVGIDITEEAVAICGNGD